MRDFDDRSARILARVDARRARRRCHGRGVFFPLLIIALGAIFLLDQLQVLPARQVFAYFWPAVFLFFGLEILLGASTVHLGAGRVGHRLWWGLAAVAIGIALILRNLGYIGFDIGRLWPLLLIFFGLSLLFRRGDPRDGRRHWPEGWSGGTGADSGESRLDGVAVLGGIERRITSQDFRGGSITAFFGGFNLDLTRAGIAGEAAVIELSALFGGGEVRVPETWIIDIQGHALLGAYSDETHQAVPASDAKRLVVQGTAVFGGVVIKN